MKCTEHNTDNCIDCPEDRPAARKTDGSHVQKVAKIDRTAQRAQIEGLFFSAYPACLTNYDLMILLELNQMGDFSNRVSRLRDDGVIRLCCKRQPTNAPDRAVQNAHVFVPPKERLKHTENILMDEEEL